MSKGIKKAYEVIDDIMQEVVLTEEESLSKICFLLERENVRFNSRLIREIISILKQWNKISVNEIKARVNEISYKGA